MAAKETDLKTIKEQLKVFLDVEIKKTVDAHGNIFIEHPIYTHYCQTYRDSDGEFQFFNILQSPSNLAKAREIKSGLIDESKDIISIGYFLKQPYRLQFLELIEDNLSLKDLSLYLAAFWGWAEKKTVIAGVKKSKVKQWLRECDKDILMCEEDKQLFDSLEEEVTIYRGATDATKDALKSTLTWTIPYDDALWYARRYLIMKIRRSYVYQATIDKKHIYACINTGTSDVIVDNKGLRDITLIDTLTL